MDTAAAQLRLTLPDVSEASQLFSFLFQSLVQNVQTLLFFFCCQEVLKQKYLGPGTESNAQAEEDIRLSICNPHLTVNHQFSLLHC